MKSIRIPFIALLTILAVSILHAQSDTATEAACLGLGHARTEKLDEAEKNYAAGLMSGNDGLVESSLYYAVRMRLACPDRNFTTLQSSVDKLVKEGRTHCIRYKASLASTVFASPRLIDADESDSPADMNSYFSNIAEQLEHKLLVSNE